MDELKPKRNEFLVHTDLHHTQGHNNVYKGIIMFVYYLLYLYISVFISIKYTEYSGIYTYNTYVCIKYIVCILLNYRSYTLTDVYAYTIYYTMYIYVTLLFLTAIIILTFINRHTP